MLNHFRFLFLAVLVSMNVISCKTMSVGTNRQASALRYMAKISEKHGDYHHAADLYEKAQKIDPTDTQHLLALAQSEMRAGKTKAAAKTYTVLLKMNPNNQAAQQGLAKVNFMRGHLKAAFTQWHQLLAHAPKDYASFNGLGLILCALHQYENAKACFLKGASLAPKHNTTLLNNAALASALAGDIPAAVKQLQLAQTLHPADRLANNLNLLLVTPQKKPDELKRRLLALLPQPVVPITSTFEEAVQQEGKQYCG